MHTCTVLKCVTKCREYTVMWASLEGSNLWWRGSSPPKPSPAGYTLKIAQDKPSETDRWQDQETTGRVPSYVSAWSTPTTLAQDSRRTPCARPRHHPPSVQQTLAAVIHTANIHVHNSRNHYNTGGDWAQPHLPHPLATPSNALWFFNTRWGIITGAPSFKRHNLVNMQFIYMKISDSIDEKVESANLKIICLLVKYSLLAAVYRDISARSL